MEWIKRLLMDKEGATAVEYGIMLAAIAGVIIITVFALGGKVENLFNSAETELDKATGS